MRENKKGFLGIVVAVLVVVVVVLAGVMVYGYFNQESGLSLTGEEIVRGEKPKEPLKVDFSRTGVVLNWDAETESYVEDWIFLYEELGAPALNVELVFDENSICDMGEGEKVCDESQLNNGDTVSIEGNRDDKKVMVIRLKK